MAGGAAGVLGGPLLERSSAAEVFLPNTADVGFLTDMTAHHAQAVLMCERVLGVETGDPVRAAATEVLRNQSIEIGMMRAWLADWGQSTAPPEKVMGWMSDSMPDHDGMNMSSGDGVALVDMPGYATESEMQALALAEPGISKGRMWLQLMRTHHVGGVAMADAAIKLVSSEKVARLAKIQSEIQTFEIEQYDLLLSTEYR